MPKFKERQLAAGDLNWAASTTKKLALPRDRFIRFLSLYLTVNGDTTTPTANEDNAAAVLKAIRVVAGGKKTLVNWPGAVFVRHNTFELGRVPTNSLSTAASQSNIVLGNTELLIPFGLRPRNPLDLSGLVRAHEMSSLDLEVDWGAASDLGTNYTIDSATLTVCANEVDLSEADLAQIGRIATLVYSHEEKTMDATYTNYNFTKDLPVGAILHRIYLDAINNSVRSNSIVTEFKVKGPDTDIIEKAWQTSQTEALARFGVPSANSITGFTIVDLVAVGGLNLVKAKAGDWQYKHNNGSPTSTSKVRLSYIQVE